MFQLRKAEHSCVASEASKMVGKLARLTEGTPWAQFWVSFPYISIALALAQNTWTVNISFPAF